MDGITHIRRNDFGIPINHGNPPDFRERTVLRLLGRVLIAFHDGLVPAALLSAASHKTIGLHRMLGSEDPIGSR